MRIVIAALGAAFFIAGIGGADAQSNRKVSEIVTPTTVPVPSGSCIYVDEGPGTDTKLCSGYAAALGAVGAASLGTGVATFLGSPVGNIVATWLAPGAAAANLGYTPPPNTRTVTGSGLLAGGGDLSDDRTITMAAIAANSVIANATGSSAVPIAVTLPNCPDTGGNHLNYASGTFSCGTSGGGAGNPGGSSGQLQYNNAGSFGGVTLGSGFDFTGGTLTLSETINTDSTASRTIAAGDANETVRLTNAGAVTVPLTAAATLGNGFGVYIECDAASCTIDPAGAETIDGAATLVLAQRQKAWIATDGTGWRGAVSPYRDPSNASNLASGTTAVARGGTGLASGTSGGILGYTASGTLASSVALTSGMPVIGGGAGATPTVGTRSGNTTAYVTTTGTQTAGNCVEIDANGNHVAAAAACGTGGGGSISVTDGTTTVNPATTLSLSAPFTVTDAGSGTATVKYSSLQNSQSGGGYTVVTGDAGKTVLVGAFTYTLPQAGTTGFESGWGACFLNVGSGSATINTTTSTFRGAGAGTSLTLRQNEWACPSSDGTNYSTEVGFWAARSGNGAAIVTTTGAQTSGRCVEIDANGNHIAAAAACGSGGGGSSTGLITLGGGGNNYSNSNTWLGVGATAATASPALASPYIVPVNMTISDMACNVNQAAGSGITHTFTANVNSSDNTNQQVSITGTTQTKATGGNAGDANVGIALVRGDLLLVKITVSSGAPNNRINCNFKAVL